MKLHLENCLSFRILVLDYVKDKETVCLRLGQTFFPPQTVCFKFNFILPSDQHLLEFKFFSNSFWNANVSNMSIVSFAQKYILCNCQDIKSPNVRLNFQYTGWHTTLFSAHLLLRNQLLLGCYLSMNPARLSSAEVIVLILQTAKKES